MPPDTEVIACPACRHLVRVPADWLGQGVQCPECKAMFRAPVRDGDRLTAPELLTAPPTTAAPVPKAADAALWLPAFGLMLVGVVSVVVNAFTLVVIARDPDAFEVAKREQVEAVAKQMGQDPQALGQGPLSRWPMYAALTGWGVVCGAAAFVGGLGIVLRRWYRLAQLGSVLAALNVANCCCVPGAVVGVWGLLMLMSDEGRAHFA